MSKRRKKKPLFAVRLITNFSESWFLCPICLRKLTLSPLWSAKELLRQADRFVAAHQHPDPAMTPHHTTRQPVPRGTS